MACAFSQGREKPRTSVRAKGRQGYGWEQGGVGPNSRWKRWKAQPGAAARCPCALPSVPALAGGCRGCRNAESASESNAQQAGGRSHLTQRWVGLRRVSLVVRSLAGTRTCWARSAIYQPPGRPGTRSSAAYSTRFRRCGIRWTPPHGAGLCSPNGDCAGTGRWSFPLGRKAALPLVVGTSTGAEASRPISSVGSRYDSSVGRCPALSSAGVARTTCKGCRFCLCPKCSSDDNLSVLEVRRQHELS